MDIEFFLDKSQNIKMLSTKIYSSAEVKYLIDPPINYIGVGANLDK